MEVKIKVLNVGDGDAIIVQLNRDGEQLVILIDGGHAGDAPKTIAALNETLLDAGKAGPDLIICTHYDADHIGGLKKICTNYKNKIGKVWIHQPGIQKDAIELATKIQNSRVITTENPDMDVAIYKNEVFTLNLQVASKMIVESYVQMENLVAEITSLGIPNQEPFSGMSIDGWEKELVVLGPTPAFYKSRYDKLISPGKLLLTEAFSLQYERFPVSTPILKIDEFVKENNDPCGKLGSQKKDHVTEVNQVSVILQIIDGTKKYLFTGDASIESFEAIPGYPESLTGIYWLKVAHHGSHNNSSPELFDIMKPTYAYISGGDRYLDNEVVGCLEAKGVIVKTTRDAQGDLIFPE